VSYSCLTLSRSSRSWLRRSWKKLVHLWGDGTLPYKQWQRDSFWMCWRTLLQRWWRNRTRLVQQQWQWVWHRPSSTHLAIIAFRNYIVYHIIIYHLPVGIYSWHCGCSFNFILLLYELCHLNHWITLVHLVHFSKRCDKSIYILRLICVKWVLYVFYMYRIKTWQFGIIISLLFMQNITFVLSAQQADA